MSKSIHRFVVLWMWLLWPNELITSAQVVHPSHPRSRSKGPPIHPAKANSRLQSLGIQTNTRNRENEDDLPPLPAYEQRVLQQTTQGDTSYSGQIRKAVLTNYDKNAYPWESVWEGNQASNGTSMRQGLPVQLGINFHKVYTVDEVSSTVVLIAWVRQSWNDPRLTWDPKSYGNVTTIFCYLEEGMSGGETSEIWAPDIELWNQVTPLAQSLANAYAIVSYTGDVFWSRPGRIQAACKFTGLDNFPYDNLGCTLEFGSWAYSGLYLRPRLMNGDGYSIGGSETSMESYAEFTLKDIQTKEHVYPPFVGAPDEDWPVLFYNITFERAWQPYGRGFIALQIVLNCVSFCCFWLPPPCGERMSLAITSLLASVASEFVVSSKLPAAPEWTWFATFTFVSMLFSSLVIFQTTVVLYFYYYRGNTLMPTYAVWMKRKTKSKQFVFQDMTLVRQKGRKPVTKQESGLEEIREGLSAEERSSISSLDEMADTTLPVQHHVDTKHDKENISGGRRRSSSESHPSVEGKPRFEMPDTMDRFQMMMNQKNSDPRFASSRTMVNQFEFARDADDFANVGEREANAKWKQWASNVDEVTRVVVPVLYTIFLAIVFSQR